MCLARALFTLCAPLWNKVAVASLYRQFELSKYGRRFPSMFVRRLNSLGIGQVGRMVFSVGFKGNLATDFILKTEETLSLHHHVIKDKRELLQKGTSHAVIKSVWLSIMSSAPSPST